MSRLIDVDKFKAYMQEKYLLFDHTLEDIDAQPTIDAVEVVRCKDCKHYVPVLDTEGGGECTDVRYELFTTPEDYCAWGERKVSL